MMRENPFCGVLEWPTCDSLNSFACDGNQILKKCCDYSTVAECCQDQDCGWRDAHCSMKPLDEEDSYNLVPFTFLGVKVVGEYFDICNFYHPICQRTHTMTNEECCHIRDTGIEPGCNFYQADHTERERRTKGCLWTTGPRNKYLQEYVHAYGLVPACPAEE